MYKILDNVQYCGGWKRVNFFSPKMYEFQFENFKNTKGGSKFFENVFIKTITQTTLKISYLQIYLYLSLPKYIYFHFDLFKWIFSFSEMGHFRSLSGMVSPHKKSLNFQMSEFKHMGGVGQHSLKMFELEIWLKSQWY